MRRKALMLFCAAVLGTASLAGCGETKTEKATQEEAVDTEKTQEETKETTEETKDDDNEAPKQTEGVSASVDEEEAKNAVDEEEALAAGFSDGTDTEETKSEESSGETGETVLNTDEQLKGIHHAEMVIKDYGTISLELNADVAPITVTNFVKLVQEDFYDGLTFHRIMDGFMMQGGDPKGDGTGGSEETIKGEFFNNGVENTISHKRGVISMARSSAPDSASSQFFIMQADGEYLDGDYAAFGKVTEGIEIVDQICKDAEPIDNNGGIESSRQPVIESITILD